MVRVSWTLPSTGKATFLIRSPVTRASARHRPSTMSPWAAAGSGCRAPASRLLGTSSPAPSRRARFGRSAGGPRAPGSRGRATPRRRSSSSLMLRRSRKSCSRPQRAVEGEHDRSPPLGAGRRKRTRKSRRVRPPAPPALDHQADSSASRSCPPGPAFGGTGTRARATMRWPSPLGEAHSTASIPFSHRRRGAAASVAAASRAQAARSAGARQERTRRQLAANARRLLRPAAPVQAGDAGGAVDLASPPCRSGDRSARPGCGPAAPPTAAASTPSAVCRGAAWSRWAARAGRARPAPGR